MVVGMLWLLSNDPRATLSAKIQQAADYYARKYKRNPDLCLVHPSALDGQAEIILEHLVIHPYRPVLPGHCWIGVDDDKLPAREVEAEIDRVEE